MPGHYTGSTRKTIITREIDSPEKVPWKKRTRPLYLKAMRLLIRPGVFDVMPERGTWEFAVKITAEILTALAVTLAAAVLPCAAALAQDQFPEGPGRDTLFLACSQCHSIGKMLQADLSAAEWQFIVYDMISRGAPVHAEDVDTLTRYLQDNFAADKN